MESENYTKPDLYLFFQHEKSSVEYIQIHIVKIEYSTYHGENIIKCADSYDFTAKPYERKITRYFDSWNPCLRFYPKNPKEYMQVNNKNAYPEFIGYQIIDLDESESIFKTLKSLSIALDKITESRGYPVDFIDAILRFGEICKVNGIAYRDKDNMVRIENLKYSRDFIARYFTDKFNWDNPEL